MIKTKMKSVYSTLTKAEKKIADYIMSENMDLQKITSYELAEITCVSQPTTIRFSRKLGFSSFNHMINGFCLDSFQNNQIKISDSINVSNNKIISQYIEIIQLSNEMNREEEINQAVEFITNSQNRVIYGSTASYQMASILSSNLNSLGILSIFITDSTTQFEIVRSLGIGDIFICVCQSDEDDTAVQLIAIAKQNGAHIISISKFGKTKISNMSDVVLKVAGVSTNQNLCSNTLKISQLYLIDMLNTNIVKSDVKRFSKFLTEKEPIAL